MTACNGNSYRIDILRQPVARRRRGGMGDEIQRVHEWIIRLAGPLSNE